SIFMFRMIVFLYEAKDPRNPGGFIEFMSYFFVLPNWAFVAMPILDYRTFRRSYFQRDGYAIAQQGIHWMFRGAVQIAILHQVEPRILASTVESVRSFPALIVHLFLFSLLFLWVSGTYHFIVGVIHLFGYDLPETNHRYALATGPLD